MAGQTDSWQKQEIIEPPNHATDPTHRELVRETAAKLYGQGFNRPKIARILLDHLVPNGKHRPDEQRLSQARARLRRWERDPKFRDMVYKLAVVQLDMETPNILIGVAKKAKRGRVDAARLALEITGRHNPKGDQTPAQVTLVVQGVPRPTRVTDLASEESVVIDGTDAMVDLDEQV